MLVPVNWLKEYVEVGADTKTFCEKMIMSGSNIETAKKWIGDYKKIVIGKIIKKEKHPEADKLFVTQIDIGTGITQIVTGADNIFEGAYIPVILDGGVLPDGKKIKKGKLRGLESNGMLCSPAELGFEDKVIPVSQRDGIMILEGEYTTGQDVAEALGVHDESVVEFEITPNRPDCLSIIGMAREAAAVFQKKVKYPDTSGTGKDGAAEDYISVEIKRPDLCKRYTARICKDIKIAPSPWWMQQRLMAAGMRPINNVVDITNYVMLEYGQPIHAFDLRQIEDRRIVVDTAQAGQKFTTLDGTERVVDQDTLMICDGKKAVAMAGVMGGLNSEIEDDTTVILIESANFHADSVRAASKRTGLRTEASSRYEKGADPNLCLQAASRVCQLIELLGAGVAVKGAVDVYPAPQEPWTVSVSASYVSKILGIHLTPAGLADLFERLEIKTQIDGDTVLATPPTVRIDLVQEIDFVEEAARIYGYDRLPSTLPKMDVKGGKSTKRELEDLAKSALLAQGFSEIQTYSFVSPKGVDQICSTEERKRSFVRIINPLGEENSVMRTTLIPGMLEALARNVSRSVSQAKVFELGKIFLDSGARTEQEKTETGKTGQEKTETAKTERQEKDKADGAFDARERGLLPEERAGLLIGAYGPKEDFYTLKGTVTEILESMGIKDIAFEPETANGTFHPGRCANIYCGEMPAGVIGELHPQVIETYDLRGRVYLAELDFERLYQKADTEKRYHPIPKYPAVQRDIAILVREEVSVGDLEKVIKSKGKRLLEHIELFDIYRGKQIKENHKSIAFSLRYRDPEKTLTEEAIGRVHQKVLDALKEQLDAELREM